MQQSYIPNPQHAQHHHHQQQQQQAAAVAASQQAMRPPHMSSPLHMYPDQATPSGSSQQQHVLQSQQPQQPQSFNCREVWASNLEQEMAHIREIIVDYPFCAMDTEFPGVVARPVGNLSQAQMTYQLMRCNVDLLRIIQLGLSFSDENGNYPKGITTWQFNFQFSLSEDMANQESIDLLIRSGIDFQQHEDRGISVQRFAELMMMSGLVLDNRVKWIAFHGSYDFGYLLHLLTTGPMPEDADKFYDVLRLYFPCIYDLKYLMKSVKTLKGGLQDVADELKVDRIGPQHQAGSDSLLTAAVFFKMRLVYFDDILDQKKYLGQLYGITQQHNKHHQHFHQAAVNHSRDFTADNFKQYMKINHHNNK